MNNIQGWFERRRSTAVSLISVGPAISGFCLAAGLSAGCCRDIGWRESLVIYGVVAGVLLFLCAFYVRASPMQRSKGTRPAEDLSHLPLPSLVIMVLLSAAGFCCCAAMAVPFVHMVAFCGDLGLSPARGTEAISLILLTAVAATFAMGRLSDHIGPLRVSILCALIQIASLVGFVFVESLSGIYTLSVIHGIPYIAIVQGYALILRRLYGPAIAGWRLGVVMLFAMAGMAVGGWLGGAIFDVTLTYRAAFQAALAFNLLNLMLLGLLYLGGGGGHCRRFRCRIGAMAHDHDHPHDHDHHDHDHGQETPEMALRVKALESLLVEKGLVDPAALDAHRRRPTRTRSARATAPVSSPAPGPIRPTRRGC